MKVHCITPFQLKAISDKDCVQITEDKCQDVIEVIATIKIVMGYHIHLSDMKVHTHYGHCHFVLWRTKNQKNTTEPIPTKAGNATNGQRIRSPGRSKNPNV